MQLYYFIVGGKYERIIYFVSGKYERIVVDTSEISCCDFILKVFLNGCPFPSKETHYIT